MDTFFPSSHTPLYEAVLCPSHEPSLAPIIKPFYQLQQALLQAPVLYLLDLTSPFSFQVIAKEEYAPRVLGHQLELSFVPNYQKKIEYTVQRWAPCLFALTAAEFLYMNRKGYPSGHKLSLSLFFSAPVPSSNTQGSSKLYPFQSSFSSSRIGRGCYTYLSAMPTSQHFKLTQAAGLTLLRYVWIICFCWV